MNGVRSVEASSKSVTAPHGAQIGLQRTRCGVHAGCCAYRPKAATLARVAPHEVQVLVIRRFLRNGMRRCVVETIRAKTTQKGNRPLGSTSYPLPLAPSFDSPPIPLLFSSYSPPIPSLLLPRISLLNLRISVSAVSSSGFALNRVRLNPLFPISAAVA